MPNSFNGIGSAYYGQSDYEQDGSFVTTKWFILGFFPVFPMESARVQYVGSSGIPFLGRTSSFELLEKLPIHWVQVIKTWLYTIFIVTLTSQVMIGNKPPVAKFLIITAGIVLPHVLRWFAKKRVGVA